MSQQSVTEIDGRFPPQVPQRRESEFLSATGRRIRDEVRELIRSCARTPPRANESGLSRRRRSRP